MTRSDLFRAHLERRENVSEEEVTKKPDGEAALTEEEAAGAQLPVAAAGADAEGAAPGKKTKKHRKKRNLWAIKITVVTLFLSAFISFLTEITSSAGNIIVTVILLLFIVLAGILADGIGVAVTSCDITPIVSMASKKEYGAKTAMWLVKNNEKVSSVCNDVVGDIISIISGSCGAAIVIAITVNLEESWQQWLSIGVSALISAVMVGGKAFLKNIAISNSKEFVMFVAKIIAVFHPEERRRRKHQAEKKKKFDAAAKKDALPPSADRDDNKDRSSKQKQKKPLTAAEAAARAHAADASSDPPHGNAT